MKKSLSERFWSKVAIGVPDDCWEWQGAKYDSGYGQIVINGKKTRAHRVSYEINVGPIPYGMVVMHSCDNRPCVNPYHLSPGTVLENNRDMVVKGRHHGGRAFPVAWGEDNHSAKLKRSDVEEIRNLYKSGWKGTVLAKKYGVSRQNIHQIVHKKIWP